MPPQPPIQSDGALLHYRQDRLSVVFLLITLALLILPLLIPIGPYLTPPWLLASCLFCFNACIVNHNHIHHPTFRNRRLDELFSHLLGFAKGHTSSGVLVAHNLNHHRYHGADRDWIRPSLAGSGAGLARLLRYVIQASMEMARERNAGGAPRLPAVRKRQLMRERASLWTCMALMLWLDWRQALLFVFLPWGVGMAMLTGVNLLQHDGCHPDDPYRNSRNFTGRLGNWFFLNNGFHTAHHLQPQLHWSCLRAFHEQELASRIPADLNESSILAYLCKQYLFAFRTQRAT